MSKKSISYKEAGVDIEAGNTLVERIKPIAARTRRPEVLTGLGGFSALFELPWAKYQQPLLVSSTDGVGTKLKLAMDLQKHNTIGIDLVAMCVNDLIVCGAEPLFFLDYYATGHLSIEIAEQVIQGIGEGCLQAGVSLVGGETAEMPGLYHDHDYDLAGFCVGIVEKTAVIDGRSVSAGDSLIGIASSGPHSNGYSLIRAILSEQGIDLHQPFDNSSLGDVLLTPTRIYVKSLQHLLKTVPVHALAHITGGGIAENLVRVLPPHTVAVINTDSWPRPAIFDWLHQQGNIAPAEFWRTFNAGIGMIACVPTANLKQALDILHHQQEIAWPIGHIESGTSEQPTVILKPQ